MVQPVDMVPAQGVVQGGEDCVDLVVNRVVLGNGLEAARHRRGERGNGLFEFVEAAPRVILPAIAPERAAPRAGIWLEAGMVTASPVTSASSCIMSELRSAMPPQATISSTATP